MLIKLGIVGAILLVGGLIFSSEIDILFPSNSISIAESLKHDIGDIGVKTSESVEKTLDISIDKVVGKTSDQINDGISTAKESSKDLSTELTTINPIKTINDFFKINPEKSDDTSEK
ncbi:MAG: hypothetical protein K5793_04720 [Nitrosarchaeum sp.]|nr:hypothetical protein [Nitrosarchaeum sp.]MCV0399395.1 hypothetical protein [Nitrosarchaeum sp.]